MGQLTRPMSAFALLWMSLVAIATGTGQPGLRRSQAQLLQASAHDGREALPHGSDFFSEDSRRIAELPGYDPAAYKRPDKPPFNADAICMPHCRWKCGPSPKCNSVCKPVCAPPKCQTLCERREESCETRCGPPQCAVVCPHNDCRKPPCAKCMTVCSPPLCTTECGETCTNVCAKPLCTWACHQDDCPRPKCEMSCEDSKPCSSGWPKQNATLPAPPGEIATVWGEASMDPAVLTKPVTPPPKWITTTQAPPPTSAPKSEGPPASALNRTEMVVSGLSRPFDSPVRALKLRWAAEDLKRREAPES